MRAVQKWIDSLKTNIVEHRTAEKSGSFIAVCQVKALLQNTSRVEYWKEDKLMY